MNLHQTVASVEDSIWTNRTLILRSVQMVHSSRRWRPSTWWIILGMFLLAAGLMFVPWRQSVVGSGRAVAFNPVERAQYIISPIDGRIKQWFVVEGDHVKAGQRIVELVDNDPSLERRLLDEELAILARLRAVEGRMEQIEYSIIYLTNSRNAQMERARADLVRDEQSYLASLKEEEELKAIYEAAVDNFDIMERQFNNPLGRLVSELQFIQAKRERDSAKAKLDRAERLVERALAQVTASKERIKQTDEDTKQRISTEQALLKSIQAELQNVQREKLAIETRIARQRAQYVNAPTDGTVFRLLVNADQGGALVRPGERMAVIVPDVKDSRKIENVLPTILGGLATLLPYRNPAEATMWEAFAMATRRWPVPTSPYPGLVVELNIDGNDLPLVEPGMLVRLQFEGWPAVQFVGWPSVARGTFGGRVYLVDPTTNEKGQFRILVEEYKHQPEDHDWPDQRYLRQGVRANGWVLMEQDVSLGWEIWRRLNGFPVSVDKQSSKDPSILGPVSRGK